MPRLISGPGTDFINPFFFLFKKSFNFPLIYLAYFPPEVFCFHFELSSLRNTAIHNVDLCFICAFHQEMSVISYQVLI